MSSVRDYLETAMKATSSVDSVQVERAAELCVECLRGGGRILFCGNGGSAADSQHFAGELVGRFRRERRGIPAIALSSNSAIITAIANDYDFESVFSRQLEALGRPGDLLVGISTSGNSANVLRAMEKARAMGMTTIGFTGAGGGDIGVLSDVCVKASSDETSHVQEALLIAGHALCHYIEIALTTGGDS